MMIQKGNDKMFGEWSNKLQNEDRKIIINVARLQIQCQVELKQKESNAIANDQKQCKQKNALEP